MTACQSVRSELRFESKVGMMFALTILRIQLLQLPL